MHPKTAKTKMLHVTLQVSSRNLLVTNSILAITLKKCVTSREAPREH